MREGAPGLCNIIHAAFLQKYLECLELTDGELDAEKGRRNPSVRGFEDKEREIMVYPRNIYES